MMDQTEGKPIPGAEGLYYYPDFSPDGQWIAAFSSLNGSDGKLKKIPVTGGTPITLASAPVALGLTWGDDDTIVFAGRDGLMRILSVGGAAQTIAKPDARKGEIAFRTPHFLPGAHALLFTIATAAASQVAALELKTGRYRVIVDNGKDARYAASGHLLYSRGDSLFAAPFDPRRLEVTGPEAPVVEGVASQGGSVAEYTIADSGLLLYMEGSTHVGNATSLGWLDRQGHVQPLSESALWGTGRLSPDGQRVANEIYTAGTGEGNPGDIWVFELERHVKTRLTFEGENFFPVWAPDGRRIIFGATLGGNKHGIYSVMADGSARPELLLATDSRALPNSWSPDGKALLYQQSAPGKPSRIWVLPVSGRAAGTPAPLHDSTSSEADAQVSPDGRWVAYVSAETGQNEVYLQPFPGPGGKERVSTQGGDSVRWSHSGRELFYMMVRNGQGALMTVDFQTAPRLHIGLPQVLTKTTFGTTWDPAPDGKHLLVEMTSGATEGARVMHGISDWFEELSRRVPVKR
jgi:Tol biopolymer transport system component